MQLTPAAAAAGVSPGMTSTQAKARCSDILFRVRSVSQEEAADEILLECAYGSAAFIEATAPGVCTLDLRGLTALTERTSIENWGTLVIRRLSEFYLPAFVGVGAAPGLALQAARQSNGVLLVTDPARFWQNLPLAELEPPAELAEVLQKWGIHTAAQFMALGKDRISERLGPAGLELFNLCRADQVRPLRLAVPKQVYEEFFEFEQPVETLEPLLFMLRRFLDQLTRRLETRSLAVKELLISLLLDSGERHDRTLEIPAPTRNVDILFRILHNYLETVRTSSPVRALQLRAQPCASEARQFQLFESAVRDPNRLYETVGRLKALLGNDRVGLPFTEPTHRPDAVQMRPVNLDAPRPPGPPLAGPRGLMLRRFRPPLAASVRLRGAAPVFVRSSQVNGAITRSTGPWRVSGNWWENSWGREEWDVETREGGLYRLFRDQTGWFVEGAYD